MATIKVGDTVPAGNFVTVHYTPELADGSACGVRKWRTPLEVACAS